MKRANSRHGSVSFSNTLWCVLVEYTTERPEKCSKQIEQSEAIGWLIVKQGITNESNETAQIADWAQANEVLHFKIIRSF